MANIKDVAKAAGVGTGTVSRALNGTGYVSRDKKERIEQIAAELGYKSNEMARNLLRNKTGIIGVVVPDIENPFFARFLKYAEIELYNRGYKALVYNTIGVSSRVDEVIDMLERKAIDGMIAATHDTTDEVFHKLKRPVVSFERDMGEHIPMVCSDHVQGGRLAAEAMIRAGCHHVLQFGANVNVKTPVNDRYHEFKLFMEDAGVQVTTIETPWNMLTYDFFYELMEQYMTIYSQADGIFAADLAAYSSLMIAKQRGIQVPDELKIVGYDGIELSRMADPVMTTVVQDIPVMARTCVEVLTGIIEGSAVENRNIIPVKLQRGGTT